MNSFEKSLNVLQYNMESQSLKTINLELEDYRDNAGTLRTDILPSAGTSKGPAFSVDFKIVYEVHGGFDATDVDNASLLVIKIVPFPKDDEKQFLWFSVKLSVHAAGKVGHQCNLDDEDDEENIPQLISFEPASGGEQFVDVYTTNEAREHMTQLNAQIPIGQGASLGGQLSATSKSEFTRTHLLRVTGKEGRSDLSLPSNFCNQAAWKICAANREQGIGNSFTVALLIKRPAGSQFQLAAQVDGDVGSFVPNVKKFLSCGVKCRKPPTSLATIPSDRSNTKVPEGVVVQELHRASRDNIMVQIPELGLHLAEYSRLPKLPKVRVNHL